VFISKPCFAGFICKEIYSTIDNIIPDVDNLNPLKNDWNPPSFLYVDLISGANPLAVEKDADCM